MSDHTLREDVTRALLINAARNGQTVTYAEVAAANGAAWRSVFRTITRHLWAINATCIANGEPMLGTLVVNRSGAIADNALDSIADHALLAGRMTKAGRRAAKCFVRCERQCAWTYDWGSR